MIPSIQYYCDMLVPDFSSIPSARKLILNQLVQYIHNRRESKQVVNLVYICTHNSRRSHFGQIWAKVAAHYFHIDQVFTFSGGTEATAFNINAINALRRIGFRVEASDLNQNSRYAVIYHNTAAPSICFSKTYDHPNNPKKDFAAIMTCSDAEQNCPFIPGVDIRIATTYEDPKAFDNSPLQDIKYDERCRQIALETFYVFSKVEGNRREV
jgi:protein-tyrosine phosphatase/arsenate reductase